MKTLGASFAVPKALPRTPVAERDAEAFVSAEAAPISRPAPKAVPAPAPVTGGIARLSVDVEPATLRALKIRAIERGVTVREYVLELLERDGLRSS